MKKKTHKNTVILMFVVPSAQVAGQRITENTIMKSNSAALTMVFVMVLSDFSD